MTHISHFLQFCRKDTHLKTSGVVTKVVAVPTEVGEVTSVDVLYRKKKGFLWGLGGGQDNIEVISVSVTSGELGDR